MILILVIIATILITVGVVQSIVLFKDIKTERVEMEIEKKIKYDPNNIYQEMIDLAKSDLTLGKITFDEYEETIKSINELVLAKVEEKCTRIEEELGIDK